VSPGLVKAWSSAPRQSSSSPPPEPELPEPDEPDPERPEPLPDPELPEPPEPPDPLFEPDPLSPPAPEPPEAPGPQSSSPASQVADDDGEAVAGGVGEGAGSAIGPAGTAAATTFPTSGFADARYTASVSTTGTARPARARSQNRSVFTAPDGISERAKSRSGNG
jgi:hypothetical protein